MNNIGIITDNLLCSACGTCAAICPKKAIKMELLPSGFFCAKVETSNCTECGLCLHCCPGVAKNEPTFDITPLSTMIGYAQEDDIRNKSQSGGVVTALLVDLLAKGEIDGAVVTCLNAEGLPEAIWADSKEKIIEAAGSVYAQSSVINVLYEHRHQKCAVVTLGCQTEAILRTCEQFKGLKRPDYIIGLICGGTMSLWMKEELMHRMHIHKAEHIDSFHYRDKADGGWPGNVTASSGEKVYHLDKGVRMLLKPAFECYRCALCAEKMNVHCDVVAGDPWQIDEEHSKGRSVVLAYTDKGARLLKTATDSVMLESISAEQICKGQSVGQKYKNRVLSHNYAAISLDKKVPYVVKKENDCDMAEAKQHLLHAEKFYTAHSKAQAMRLARQTARKIEQPIKNHLYELKNKLLGK